MWMWRAIIYEWAVSSLFVYYVWLNRMRISFNVFMWQINFNFWYHSTHLLASTRHKCDLGISYILYLRTQREIELNIRLFHLPCTRLTLNARFFGVIRKIIIQNSSNEVPELILFWVGWRGGVGDVAVDCDNDDHFSQLVLCSLSLVPSLLPISSNVRCVRMTPINHKYLFQFFLCSWFSIFSIRCLFISLLWVLRLEFVCVSILTLKLFCRVSLEMAEGENETETLNGMPLL